MTKIYTCWPGNNFTYSFYLQTISVAVRETHSAKRPETHDQPQQEREIVCSKRERERSRHRTDRRRSWSRDRRSRSRRSWSRSRSHRSRSRLRLSGFDDFFSGFCLCFEEWICIRLVIKKMWATSRKCVFYGIFKNTTKHQKIFSETFFEMQPNTWKYFLFRKIAFSKNIYFSEILLHEPNATYIITPFELEDPVLYLIIWVWLIFNIFFNSICFFF